MIAGSQPMEEGAVSSGVTTSDVMALRKRGCRYSRPIAVIGLPTVVFAVPIFYELERTLQRTKEMALVLPANR